VLSSITASIKNHLHCDVREQGVVWIFTLGEHWEHAVERYHHTKTELYLSQAVSRRLSTAEARARSWGTWGAGAGFLRVLKFPLPVLIPLTVPRSSSSSSCHPRLVQYANDLVVSVWSQPKKLNRTSYTSAPCGAVNQQFECGQVVNSFLIWCMYKTNNELDSLLLRWRLTVPPPPPAPDCGSVRAEEAHPWFALSYRT
jgi:hypothetical protein